MVVCIQQIALILARYDGKLNLWLKRVNRIKIIATIKMWKFLQQFLRFHVRNISGLRNAALYGSRKTILIKRNYLRFQRLHCVTRMKNWWNLLKYFGLKENGDAAMAIAVIKCREMPKLKFIEHWVGGPLAVSVLIRVFFLFCFFIWKEFGTYIQRDCRP